MSIDRNNNVVNNKEEIIMLKIKNGVDLKELEKFRVCKRNHEEKNV